MFSTSGNPHRAVKYGQYGQELWMLPCAINIQADITVITAPYNREYYLHDIKPYHYACNRHERQMHGYKPCAEQGHPYRSLAEIIRQPQTAIACKRLYATATATAQVKHEHRHEQCLRDKQQIDKAPQETWRSHRP